MIADGVAIAWAVSEHLISLGTATLFATHFAQLSDLATLYPNARLWHFEATASAGARARLTFTHRLLPGSPAGSHYGLTLASSVCMPPRVVQEARRIATAVDAAAAPPSPQGSSRAPRHSASRPARSSDSPSRGASGASSRAAGSSGRRPQEAAGCEARRALYSLAHRARCVAQAWAGNPAGVDLAAQLGPLQQEARQLLGPGGGLGAGPVAGTAA